MTKEKSEERKKKKTPAQIHSLHVTYLVWLARQYWNRWEKSVQKNPPDGEEEKGWSHFTCHRAEVNILFSLSSPEVIIPEWPDVLALICYLIIWLGYILHPSEPDPPSPVPSGPLRSHRAIILIP